MSTSFREAVLDGLALLLPVECAGCGAPDRAVCGRCLPALVPDAGSRPLPGGIPVFSGLDYDGVVREVLLAYKEQGRTELARHLAPALAAAVTAAVHGLGLDGVEVVTVPGTPRARRRRGFDPVALLVARAGLDRARVFAPPAPHAAQKTLSLEERSLNLAGVFATRGSVGGRRFLLVDDVVTSGATLVAAASALREAGAEVVAAAVVASTPRLFGGSVVTQRERSAAFP